jgi:tetratricopeptide (TPR) repeat protein
VSPFRQLLLLLILAAVALAAYANSFDAALVQDSKARILHDPRLRGVTVTNITGILAGDYWFPIVESGLYRPVTTLSYLFNYAVLANGERPPGYHWVNFLVHYVNAVLVYFLAAGLFARAAPAFFTAALFAVHPVCTEAVTNIAGRPDLLAAAAVLGGLLIHARAARSAGAHGLLLGGGLAMTAFLGLLCKESAVVLPVLMVLFDLTRGQQERPRPAPSTAGLIAARLLSPGYVLVAVAMLAWLAVRRLALGTLAVPRPPFVDNPLAGADFWTARITAVKVLGRSLLLLAWPFGLSCDYSYDQIPLVSLRRARPEDLEAVLAFAVVIGAILIAIHFRHRNRALCFFIGFALLTMLPTSNLIVPIGSIMADRFLYLPAVGYVGCLVATIEAARRWLVFDRKPGPGREAQRGAALAAVLLTLVLVCYITRSYVRNADWTSELRLWRAAAQASPSSFRVHLALAYLLYSEDPGARNIDLAIQEAEKAAAIIEAAPLPDIDIPVNVFGHLGAYYSTKADQLRRPATPGSVVSTDESRRWYEKAAATLDRAVSIDRALNEQHRQEEMRRGRRPSEIRDIGDQDVYHNLGMARMRLGQYRQAIDAWTYLLRLAPMRVDVHARIALLLRLEGRNQQALVGLHQSLLLDPRNEEVMKMLTGLYREIDPGGCAVRGSGEKLDLEPLCPAVKDHTCLAYGGLVELFSESKQFVRARQMQQQAVQEGHCPPDRLPVAAPARGGQGASG